MGALAECTISYSGESGTPRAHFMNIVSAPEAHGDIKPWSPSSRFNNVFQTSNHQAAEHFFLRDLVPSACNVRLKFGSNINIDIRTFDFSSLQLSAIRYGTELNASFQIGQSTADKPWIFSYSLGGQCFGKRLKIQTNAGDAVLFRIDGPADFLLSSDYQALTLMVSADDMTQAYRSLHGNDFAGTPELDTLAVAGSPAALTLLRTITRLAETPRYRHQAAHRLERGIKEAALLEILMNWPGAILPTTQDSVLPASTRLARDFIHAHIKDLPTVSDIAASCRIGVRALDRGFKKNLGVSPLQYMLGLRLQGVHDDLIANRNGNTVTEVAIHWGFSNLGIFAARYRERFGELPSQTLLQSRQLRQRLN